MNIEKLDYEFDIIRLVDECVNLQDTIGFCPDTNQIGLKHTENIHESQTWYQGCGQITHLMPKFMNKDFTVINENLKGSYLEYVIKELQKTYAIGRARIMRLEPRKCMSLHVDLSKRIHIPVITNLDALMIINNEVHHMPADGSAYLTDTTKRHTALNASKDEERLHLLFDLV
tara:strand:+ start:2261 stop:2779 length:519 start_codon:yes stop_codon:yes gene_type:complete